MKRRGFMTLTLISLLALAGLTLGGRSWSVQHVRRWTGRPDLGFVSCNHCHGQKLEGMPWAKPRPRHAAPAGLVVSADGRHVYVALDDIGEVIEADTTSRTVTRRLPLTGRPFAVAISKDQQLFVACRDTDEVVAVDLKQFQLADRVEVGEAPVALAFCTTPAGDRLLVANSLSDNVSVLAVGPLREISRPQSGREPYAVAVAEDGAVA
jgi:DNA-binding beta-propeller fold protein YncE